MPTTDEAAPRPSALSEAGAIFRRLGPASFLAIIAAAFPAIGGFVLLAFVGTIAAWLQTHGTAGVTLYATVFAVGSGFALLPTYSQAILGGWAFGFSPGLPAALAGFVGGALIGYGVARTASGDRVTALINEKPKWKAVYDALLGAGFWQTLGIVTLLRIPPNSPFAITNLVMAATRVPIVPYIIGTFVGMTPRTAVAVYLGTRLEQDFSTGKPWWMIVTSIALAIIVIAVIGHIGNQAIARIAAASERETPSDRAA